MTARKLFELYAPNGTDLTRCKAGYVSKQTRLMYKGFLLCHKLAFTSTLLHAFPTYERAGRVKKLGPNNHARTLEL